jgi:hypothetical protein
MIPNTIFIVEAVYFTGSDSLLGPLLAIVYKETLESKTLSIIIIGRHGVFGSTNITIDSSSRYYGACLNLPTDQRSSAVRKALAIGCLRTYASMEPSLKTYLTSSLVENQNFHWDETTAGTLASSLKPALGKYPNDIGNAVINSGILQQKSIKVVTVDIVYKNSREFNFHNDELGHLFGNQLEHLFDPLAEYCPEPKELLYNPPSHAPSGRSSDDTMTRNICHELLTVQAHFTTNLINFLQDYLIPLRVKILGGEIPGMNMKIINTIFPPTIDEVVRVNNILFDALSKSVEHGSYEMIKACGVSVPYFYKTCMRHEAATKNFTKNLRQHMRLIQSHAPFIDKFTINRIESIINCSLHLTKIKLILDRLVGSVSWSASEKVSVFEFYESAVGTIHSFGQENCILPYDNRIFTSNGRLLVELSKNWPKELEYGWINRRVVTIFDAFDVMSSDGKSLNLVFIFNDSVVVLKPAYPIRPTSETNEPGFDKLSIADIIMHSMINSVPLPKLCELDVVGWAPIEDIYMSEFGTFDLAMYITGAGLLPALTQASPPRHRYIFKLIRTKLNASDIARDVSKAKIVNKTEQFHLFYNKQPNFTTFGTAYEAARHKDEINKSPIALYFNMPMPDYVLDDQNLIACIKTTFYGRDHVGITIKSKLNYNIHEIVTKQRFSAEIFKHILHLYNLFFASSNPFTTEMTIQNNTSLANYLINYATTRSHYPKTTNTFKPRICSSSTFVTSPALNQKFFLRQRVSSASFLLTKLSQKFSQEPVHRKASDSTTDSKKRFSISLFSRDKTPKLDDCVTAGFEKSEMPTILLASTVSSPAELVEEKPNTIQHRYRFPFVTKIPIVSTPAPTIESSTVSEPTTIMAQSPNFDDCETITTSRPGSILRTSKTLLRKISFSGLSTASSKKELKLPNYPHISFHKSAMPDSTKKDIGAVNVVSSSFVKDTESFICENSSVAPSSDMVLPTTTPSNSVFASTTIPPVEVYPNIGQYSQRTSSRLSEASVQSTFSSAKNWYAELIHENSAGSLETDYTFMTETSLDEESITQSTKTITSFLETSTVSSHCQPPRVISAETVPQLPPIIFDDSDSLLDLVALQSQPTTPFGSERKQQQHQRMTSIISDDWQTISDDVSSLHLYHHHRKLSGSASLKKDFFANNLAELTTTENHKQLDFVQRIVDHLQASTYSLPPMPRDHKLTKHDQDRIVCVESSNRTMLMSCLWTLLTIKSSGPAVQQFLSLEWQRRSLMRQKLGEAKPIQLWEV